MREKIEEEVKKAAQIFCEPSAAKFKGGRCQSNGFSSIYTVRSAHSKASIALWEGDLHGVFSAGRILRRRNSDRRLVLLLAGGRPGARPVASDRGRWLVVGRWQYDQYGSEKAARDAQITAGQLTRCAGCVRPVWGGGV